jgi:hypothetical protein
MAKLPDFDGVLQRFPGDPEISAVMAGEWSDSAASQWLERGIAGRDTKIREIKEVLTSGLHPHAAGGQGALGRPGGQPERRGSTRLVRRERLLGPPDEVDLDRAPFMREVTGMRREAQLVPRHAEAQEVAMDDFHAPMDCLWRVPLGSAVAFERGHEFGMPAEHLDQRPEPGRIDERDLPRISRRECDFQRVML